MIGVDDRAGKPPAQQRDRLGHAQPLRRAQAEHLQRQLGQLHRFDDGEAKPPGRPLEAGRRVDDEKLPVFVAVLRQHENVGAGRLFPVLDPEAADDRGAAVLVVFEDAHVGPGRRVRGNQGGQQDEGYGTEGGGHAHGSSVPFRWRIRRPEFPGTTTPVRSTRGPMVAMASYQCMNGAPGRGGANRSPSAEALATADTRTPKRLPVSVHFSLRYFVAT